MCGTLRGVDGAVMTCAGRALGFDGKTLIHPKTIEVCNEVYGPTLEDLELAKRHLAAFEAAAAAGEGVAVVDGQLVEVLHANEARDVIRFASMIEEMAHGP